MAKYNGIELPSLPEYDAAAYPRAYIVQVAEDYSVESVAGQYLLCLVDGSATIAHSNDDYAEDTGVILFTGVTAHTWYLAADGAWEESDILASDSGICYILRPDILEPVWANFDIPAADGTVYLAASEPEEEETEETTTKWPGLKSWLAGLVIGLAGKPQPMNARTPLAYSYNGVVLPALPEWDREAYPYAVLRAAGSPGYMLICSASETTYSVSANKYTTTGPAVVYVLPYKDDAGEWVDLLEQEWQFYAEYSGEHSFTLAFWTNTDILNEDGTTYLAASDPIPVYE